MFKSEQDKRNFYTIVLTYTLDLIGYSLAFPVLSPLFLDKNLHFFEPGTSEIFKTSVLGWIFAIFGIAQLIAAPLNGMIADYIGRKKVFIYSIIVSIIGYLLSAWAILDENILLLFLGRIITGFSTGNAGLALAATSDVTDEKNRSRAFGLLIGIGGTGFIFGPWLGGKLGSPSFIGGSGAFFFGAAIALLNLFSVLLFYKESFVPRALVAGKRATAIVSDFIAAFKIKNVQNLLTANTLYFFGWAFFVIFFSTYLVQKFGLKSDVIGDIYAYNGIVWAFTCVYLQKQLEGIMTLKKLVFWGFLLNAVGVVLCVSFNALWPYWILIPITLGGAALAWVNSSALLSKDTSSENQGKVQGANASLWALGQIAAPLFAGPLAGIAAPFPLLLGGILIFAALFIFTLNKQKV